MVMQEIWTVGMQQMPPPDTAAAAAAVAAAAVALPGDAAHTMHGIKD